MKLLLSILDNKLGNVIAEEIKSNMNKFDIVEFKHNGKLYEYSGILKAAKLSLKLNEPVLYMHTKGAANQSSFQAAVRQLWYDYWNDDIMFNTTFNKGITTIYLGPEGQTWFNSFVIYPDAAKQIVKEMIKSNNRYYYEELPKHIKFSEINVPCEVNKGISAYDACNDVRYNNLKNRIKNCERLLSNLSYSLEEFNNNLNKLNNAIY